MSEQNRTPEIRHRLPDRLFHWVMALAVINLGATAFLPLIGVRFEWVPIHWWSGVVLTLAVLYHLWRVLIVHGVREMTPGADDVREVLRDLRGAGLEGLDPAKYDAFQKAYHLMTSLVVLVLIGTGITMLAKIDTIFWSRNPAILTDPTWGVIYVTHGAAAMVLLFLFMLHVYFGVLPEHRDYLVAMIRGRGPAQARRTHG
jgi:formate dehydrogenase subunit gamma